MSEAGVGAFFLDYADAEFDGESWNGDCLMKTLTCLAPLAAFDTDTREGYSAWSVAVHVAFFKHYVAKALLGEEAAGNFPFEVDEHEFGTQGERDAEAEAERWQAILEYLPVIHEVTSGAIREASPAKFAETVSGWTKSLGELVGWYLSHDSYHIAQLRSMGVPGLNDR